MSGKLELTRYGKDEPICAKLRKGLGIIEAEQFISVVIREKFDYTQWQRDYFDSIPDEALMAEAVAYDKAHPYKGAPSTVI